MSLLSLKTKGEAAGRQILTLSAHSSKGRAVPGSVPVLATAPRSGGHCGTPQLCPASCSTSPCQGSWRFALTACPVCLWGALKAVGAVVNECSPVWVSTGVARG